MNHDELFAEQERFRRDVVKGAPLALRIDGETYGLPFDLSELPEQGSWDAWADEASAADGPAEYGGCILRMTEYERRRALVDWARSLATSAGHEKANARFRAELAELPAMHDRQRRRLLSELRAYDAYGALKKLPPKQQRRAACVLIRCPSGCILAQVWQRRPQPDSDARETLLIAGRSATGAFGICWLSPDAEDLGSPSRIELGCRHGSGSLATTVALRAELPRQRTLIIEAIDGASWRPKRT